MWMSKIYQKHIQINLFKDILFSKATFKLIFPQDTEHVFPSVSDATQMILILSFCQKMLGDDEDLLPFLHGNSEFWSVGRIRERIVVGLVYDIYTRGLHLLKSPYRGSVAPHHPA